MECSFGVIADVQYADIEDGYNFDGSQLRKYRAALTGLKDAIDDFNKHKPDFVLQLGDLIDGQNAGKYGVLVGKEPQTDKAFTHVMNCFQKLHETIKVYHSVGNHELYNFTWNQLSERFNSARDMISTENGQFYFSFNIGRTKNWKIIHLNPYHVTLMQSKDYPGFEVAKNFLKSSNPNFEKFYPQFDPDCEQPAKQCSFFEGLDDMNTYKVPYNGGFGVEQLNWLREELKEAEKRNEKCIVVAHIPLSRGEDNLNSKTLVYDHDEIHEIFQNNKGVIKLVLNGHRHYGYYYHDQELGIHFCGIQSPLLFGTSHAIVNVYSNRIEVEGKGGVPSRIMKV